MYTIRQITLAVVYVAAIASPAALIPSTSRGQAYPSKPIRIIVPFSPGGGMSDYLARIIGQKLSESWRQPVVVDNRPGARGVVGGSILVKAPPDGHTLMVYSDGHATNAALYNTALPYDTLHDFVRVSLLASTPSVLVIAPSLGVKSVKDLIVLAKAKPGQLSFGSAGLGGGLTLPANYSSRPPASM